MYEHGTNHVIEWIMIQVEPKGDFSLLKKYTPDANHVINWNVIHVIRVTLFSLLVYTHV